MTLKCSKKKLPGQGVAATDHLVAAVESIQYRAYVHTALHSIQYRAYVHTALHSTQYRACVHTALHSIQYRAYVHTALHSTSWCSSTVTINIKRAVPPPREPLDRVRYQVSQCGTETGFSASTSVFPCQYHSTIAPYSFIHLPPTLYNVFLPVLQFSPVSIIPPLLHTHSSIYHPRCIMFFSQYFSFPLSVSFHHCSILIHPSTTHAV